MLADEINRSPAKVQSALLEAMQERQVTIGDDSFPLPQPFLVMATQNPIEQEGTYPLPEAQVDRFMLKVVVSYPKKEEEKLIIRMNNSGTFPKPSTVLKPEDIVRALSLIHISSGLGFGVLGSIPAATSMGLSSSSEIKSIRIACSSGGG